MLCREHSFQCVIILFILQQNFLFQGVKNVLCVYACIQFSVYIYTPIHEVIRNILSIQKVCRTPVRYFKNYFREKKNLKKKNV